MMAERVKAWACGYCNKVHRWQRQANACCRCRECGINSGQHIATDRSMCKQCQASRELASALDNLEHATARLRKAKGAHVR